MIRKPAEYAPRGEDAVVRTFRSAANVAQGGAKVARTGGHIARGLFCYFLAAIWGFAALAGGLLAGDMATFIFVGAMAGGMAWAGRRAFAKARAAAG